MASPSPYVNAADTNTTYSKSSSVSTSHPSVPPGTPASLFTTERYDAADGAELQYSFPVPAGDDVEVRLYFAEIYSGAFGNGERIFDVAIDDTVVVNDLDIYATVGARTGYVETIPVTSDGTIDIEFLHQVENPAIKAIEILGTSDTDPDPDPATLATSPGSIDFGDVTVGTDATTAVTLTNTADTTGSTIAIDSISLTGTGASAFAHDATTPLSLTPGQQASINVTFAPAAETAYTATLAITHDGANTPTTIDLTGQGTAVPLAESTVLYRVNAGGPVLPGEPAWSADTMASPSPYVNAADTNTTYSKSSSVSTSHPSVPSGTPASLFTTERYDAADGAELQYSFPVPAGDDVEVRLYFAEIYSGAFGNGERIFDVAIDDTVVVNDLDIYATVGARTGYVETIPVTSDGAIDIEFLHQVENPAIKAIEILGTSDTDPIELHVSRSTVDFGAVSVGQTTSAAVTLTNSEATGGSDITITSLDIVGTDAAAFSHDANAPIQLAPGQQTTVNITFTPESDATATATLSMTHDGTNSPQTIALTGQGTTPPSSPGEILYRINAGGPAQIGDPTWQTDTKASPSPYVNSAATNDTYTSEGSIDLSHPSVPADTPAAVFTTERWDPPGDAELKYSLPVPAGELVDVRLYLAEIYDGIQGPGQRVFDVAIDGQVVIDNLDIYATVGDRSAYVETVAVNSDGAIDIEFLHQTENPAIKAIEIVRVGPRPGELGAVPDELLLQPTSMDPVTGTVQVRNLGATGDPDIVVDATEITGEDAATFSDDFDDTTTIVLAPGETHDIAVTLSPDESSPWTATLEIVHDGVGGSLSVPLTGSAITASFLPKSSLVGATPSFPTSLAWGPDGRLYVATIFGEIHVYGVARNGPGEYTATSEETINLIADMPNRDDNGHLNPTVEGRLVTGIDVVGTAENPTIYAVSSDPRIGGGTDGTDLPLDTNSGILSRLRFDGAAWQKLDLVRGLPRSEENHTGNGIVVDEASGTAFIAYGGHTNKGAPSHNFVGLSEYALSAAILSVDLDVIGDTTYDLPTLDDEDREGPIDANDPFGGNGGKNQARLVAGGPVDVYSPGWRNPYDLVITESGQMYAVDNGGNAGWGGYPKPDSSDGTCTNDVVNDSDSDPDTLIRIPGPGYYAGHPNPVRANPSITFNNTENPQSPVDVPNPIECNYLDPETERNALAIFPESTNGLAEYTTSNFGGALEGALLTASYDKAIHVVHLDETGTNAVSSSPLFSNVGSLPLDVIASSADDPFPGTVLVADAFANSIIVLEPTDYDGSVSVCVGTDDPDLDEDDDGYDNSDEIANETDPCSAGDVPSDNDGDLESDLIDEDDDNDGISDVQDAFALDSENGRATELPVTYDWENDGSTPGGLFNLGFTGLMSNGVANYLTQFDSANMTAGGAAGITTIDQIGPGTAHGSSNDQQYGFQFGIDVDAATGPFTVSTGLVAPFPADTAGPGQELGLFFGTGDQDNYVELVASSDSGGQIVARVEIDGVLTTVATLPTTLPGPEEVTLHLRIDPTTSTAQAYAAFDGAAPVAVGEQFSIPADWFEGTFAPAVGLIATSASGPFTATWDFIHVVPENSPEPATGSTIIEVNSGEAITSSTYNSGSFRITNTSDDGSRISSVTFDLSTSLLPDVVFDPDGEAGDLTAKDLEVDSEGGTGYSSRTFSGAHDGGYDAVTLDFVDFDSAEVLTFSVDVDPTSIRGDTAPGPNETGSVSGLELAGATVTVVYEDGTTQTTRLFRSPGSLGNSRAVLTGDVPPTPVISLSAGTSPTTTSNSSVTVNVSGAPNSTVRLAAIEGGLYLSGVPDGGYDIDPYEANTIVRVTEFVVTLDATGSASVPIALSASDASAGIWHIVAATDTGGGQTGAASDVLVVRYATAT